MALAYTTGKRPGRHPIGFTEEQGERNHFTDDFLDQLQYKNPGLTADQIEVLRNQLDKALVDYDEKKDSNKTVKEINEEAINDFLTAKRVEAKSETTIYNYGAELHKLVTLLDKDYREITSDDIRKYLSYRKEHDGLSNASLNNMRMYLKSFFKWCFIEEKIRKNPMDKINPIKAPKKVISTLSDEQMEIIRSACTNERELAILDTLSGTGMRVSELRNLNRSDVDFQTGEIKVFGKGSKERICYLTGKAKVHLQWYLEQRTDDNPALFVTAKKPYTRLTKNGVEFVLNEIVAKSRIPDLHISPHELRRTFATDAINRGAPAELIQQLLGHSSVSTTLTSYAKINDNTIKAGHDKYIV